MIKVKKYLKVSILNYTFFIFIESPHQNESYRTPPWYPCIAIA